MPTVREILNEARKMQLDSLSAEVWLGFVLGREKSWIFAHGEEMVMVGDEQKFWSGAEEMLGGKPVAQLTGSKEFYGLDFWVTDQVLVPRPESELIVDLVKDFVMGREAAAATTIAARRGRGNDNSDTSRISESRGGRVTVVDVGTGSGCILLAILSVLPEARGIGVEISATALEVAKENTRRLGFSKRVELIQGNLLEPVDEAVEVIVANLPYIGRERFNFVAENVARHEPEVALYGGSDGLDLYREMFAQLVGKSWRPAFLAGEFGFGQEEVMRGVLQEYFFDRHFEIIDDLAGIPRVFVVNFD